MGVIDQLENKDPYGRLLKNKLQIRSFIVGPKGVLKWNISSAN
jgi:hypothetical protein